MTIRPAAVLRVKYGPYAGRVVTIVRKVAGTNDAWFGRIDGFEGLVMVYANEIGGDDG